MKKVFQELSPYALGLSALLLLKTGDTPVWAIIPLITMLVIAFVIDLHRIY